jgi:hypothetical protein
MALKVLCYAGGVGSLAMLLRALRTGERPDLAVFADTHDIGEDSRRRERTRKVITLCRKFKMPFNWLEKDQPIEGTYCQRIESFLQTKYPSVDSIELWLGYLAGEEALVATDPCAKGARFPLIEVDYCICRALRLCKHAGFLIRGDHPCPRHTPVVTP